MQHTETITIDRPAEEVWDYIGDVDSWPKWIDDMTDVEVPEGGMAIGSQVTYKYRGTPTHPTIAAYEAGRTIGIQSSEDRYEFAETITLSPKGEQTEVSFTMGFQPTVWWMKLMAVALAPFRSTVLGRGMRKSMQSLKKAVESESRL